MPMKVKLKSTMSIDQWHTALIKCHWDFESKKAEFWTLKRFKRIIKLFNITVVYSIFDRLYDQSELFQCIMYLPRKQLSQ